MFNRRTLIAQAAGLLALVASPLLAQDTMSMASTQPMTDMEPTTHIVEMLNQDPDNPREKMVFSDPVLFINPGDTVQFKATDRAHNSESDPDMIPDGAEGWKGRINQDVEATLDVEGIYVYKCTPHSTMGMYGIIVVGDPTQDQIEALKDYSPRGRMAQERVDTYIAQALEELETD